MGILSYIVFGLIVGIIANFIDPKPSSGGIIGSIILGIVGAIVGGYLGEMIFGVGVSGFNIPSIIVATLGALLVLFVVRMFRKSTV